MRKYVVVVCMVIAVLFLLMPSVPAIELDTAVKTQKEHVKEQLELTSYEKLIEDLTTRTDQTPDMQVMIAILDNGGEQQLCKNLLVQLIAFILNVYFNLYVKAMLFMLRIYLLPLKIILLRASLLFLPLKILKIIVNLLLIPLKLMFRLIVLPFKLVFGIFQLLLLPFKILHQLLFFPLATTRCAVHHLFDYRHHYFIG